MEAARALLGDHGTEFSVQQLADKAHVSRASFYTHFSGIDDVLRVVLFSSVPRMRDAYESELLAGEISPREAMHNANARFVDAMWDNRTVLSGLLRGPLRAQTRDTIVDGVARELNRSFERRITMPPPGIRPEITALYIAGATGEIMTAWLTGTLEATRDEVLRQFDDLMPRWLAKADGAPSPVREAGAAAPDARTMTE